MESKGLTEAEGKEYLGRTPIPHSSEEISDLGYSHCSFSRRCLHHHFAVGVGGVSWTKWEAQSRSSLSQTPQELLKLQKSQSKPIPPHHCWDGVKQQWAVKDFQPLLAISWAGKRCAESYGMRWALRNTMAGIFCSQAQFHVLRHIQVLSRIRQSRAGARQPPCLGSLPVPRALRSAGGTAPAPRLTRWLPILVNDFPGSAAGVYPNP